MSDRYVYTLWVPDGARVQTGAQNVRNVSKKGTVTTGSNASAEPVSMQPGEKVLAGWIGGKHSTDVAKEFEELFSSSGIELVPYRGPSGGNAPDSGYYSVENVSVQPREPRQENARYIDAQLVRKGTRSSHFRSVQTTVIEVDNDFGNTLSTEVGVPQTASKVRWFDPSTKGREKPTVQSTRAGEFGNFDIVDADASSYDDPTLIYDLPYSEEGKFDCVLWDDVNSTKEVTDTDVNGDSVTYVRWNKAFSPEHEFVGNPVLETRRLRLEFDVGNNTLNAWRWDDANSTYSSVSLGSSDWELYDYDFYEIGMAEIKAQVEFRDPTQSPTAYFVLDIGAKRGANSLQWVVPENETGPTPSGLQTRLDPIANGLRLDAQPVKGLTKKSEVRK